MRRRATLTAVAAVSTLTILAGCGSSSSGGGSGGSGGGSNNASVDPKTELTNAFHSLSQGSALTTTISLDTTAANLQSLTNIGPDKTPITPTQANLIAGAKITIETVAPSGKTLAQASTPAAASGASFSLTGTAGGSTYFTLLDVNKNLYLQVDLKGLLTAAGQGALYQGIVAQTASLPAFAQAFIAGKFVSLPFSTISSLESLLKGAAQGQGTSQIPDSSQIQALIGQLEAAVLGDLTVTRTSSGATDALEISGNIRDIATDLLTTISSAIPAAASQISPSEANQAPNVDLKAEASVTGGALSQLAFKFSQLGALSDKPLTAKQQQEASEAPTVVASFVKSGPAITAPSGAVPVNFQDLVQFFTAIGGS